MSIRARLIGNAQVVTAGLLAAMVVQFASVPGLLIAWGPERYGAWIMFSTVPVYLSLADFGMGAVALSRMTIAYGRGDHPEIATVFQGAWCMLAAVLSLVLSVVALHLALAWLTGAGPDYLFASLILSILVFYTAASILCRLCLSALQATGSFIAASWRFHLAFLVEGLLVVAVALLGGGFLACALFMLVFRTAVGLAFAIWLRRACPFISFGCGRAARAEMRALIRPGLEASGVSAAAAFNIQGVVLVVGAFVSLEAVATLGAVRTASRLALQVAGVAARATMPELGLAIGRGDGAAVRKLALVNLAVLLGVLLPSALLFAWLGTPFIALWTAGKVMADPLFVALMAAVMLLHGAWFFAGSQLIAINAHGGLGTLAFVTSVLVVLGSIPAAQHFGLRGAALAVLFGELVCCLGFLVLLRQSPLMGGRAGGGKGE